MTARLTELGGDALKEVINKPLKEEKQKPASLKAKSTYGHKRGGSQGKKELKIPKSSS